MLNKHNLSITQFATRDESRYSLAGILVTPKETVATNGFTLAKVTTPKGLKVENFPVTPGVKPSTTFKPFNLPLDAADTIRKAIPKKCSIPILDKVMIDGKATDAKPTDGTPDYAVLAVNDLENPQVFRPIKMSGQFPKWETVVPKRKDAKFAICLDARMLAKIAAWAAKFGDPRAPEIRIRFYGDTESVRFDARNDAGQEFTAILMSRRGPSNWKNADY